MTALRLEASEGGEVLASRKRTLVASGLINRVRAMFDFNRWCQWARSNCQQTLPNSVSLTFERGAPSPKQGASISFEKGTKLMQLQFWETGESDFHGIDLPTGRGVIVFAGRILDDQSFEETVRECLAAVE